MRHWLPRLLIVASLGLHVITAASYIRQPDLMAAFTVYPIWMWSFIGLILSALAFLFLACTALAHARHPVAPHHIDGIG